MVGCMCVCENHIIFQPEWHASVRGVTMFWTMRYIAWSIYIGCVGWVRHTCECVNDVGAACHSRSPERHDASVSNHGATMCAAVYAILQHVHRSDSRHCNIELWRELVASLIVDVWCLITCTHAGTACHYKQTDNRCK